MDAREERNTDMDTLSLADDAREEVEMDIA
jgi:hypothetical protein